jgi:hypothetical protein
VQLTFDDNGQIVRTPRPISREWATTGILSALENFLSQHTSSEELGLRLAGEQLAAGVRFVRILRERQFDIVFGNPPYQGTNKLRDSSWYENNYRLAKTDLFAGMTVRALELLRPSGTCAMIALSNWMYIKSFVEFRTYVLSHHLSAIADLGKAAFSTGGTLISTACYVVRNIEDRGLRSVAIRPMSPDEVKRDSEQPSRCEAALRLHRGRYDFHPASLQVVPEWPLVYWWDVDTLKLYITTPLIADIAPARQGLSTGDNSRFLRLAAELQVDSLNLSLSDRFAEPSQMSKWMPLVKGAAGVRWVHPTCDVVNWKSHGLEIYVASDPPAKTAIIRNPKYFGRRGVAFTTLGNSFGARVYRHAAIFEAMGRTIFCDEPEAVCCFLNSSFAGFIAKSLNPTVHFTVGDINRLPLLSNSVTVPVFSRVDSAFSIHESHREPSVEFRQPGPSPWRHAQEWAQLAVDRPDGAPLPEYVEELDPEPPTDHVSFAVGVALGRFGAHGEGILDSRLSLRESRVTHSPGNVNFAERNSTLGNADSRLSLRERNATDDGGDARFAERNATLSTDADFAERNPTLPHGILFLDGTLIGDVPGDSLSHPAARIIHDKWADYGPQIDRRRSVRDWLREKFFADVHKGMYENRPIHWPLSSAKKTFVAWVTIHRWDDKTLRILLADHLEPALKRLDGEIADMVKTRATAEGVGESRKEGRSFRGAKGDNERYADVTEWRRELAEFIEQVKQCAERGPKAPDEKKPEREVDARYIPDVDDGVMINSSALWPLLEPQWKDPKKWWKELVAAKGKKDYDWSHLAMRYWPTRVDEKCRKDPSLGVAHGCFWAYHPARAWAWELRLQDEIGPEFRIEESSLSLCERNATDGGRGANFAERNSTESTSDANFAERNSTIRGGTDSSLSLRERNTTEGTTDGRVAERNATENTNNANFAERNSTIRNAADSRLSLRERNTMEGTMDVRFAERNATNSTNNANFAERNSTICRAEYLRKYPVEALEAIEKEVLRRKRKRKKPVTELTILESGLWSKAPADCWALELRLTEKLQVEFRLLAPDEPESRDAFEKSHPDKVKSRKALLGRLRPPDLFADEEEDQDDEELESEVVEDEESEIEDP